MSATMNWSTQALLARKQAVRENEGRRRRAAQSHLLERRPNAEPRRALLHQEGGHPFGAFTRLRRRQHQVEIGGTGVGDEELFPVQDVAPIDPPGRGLEGGGVGPRLRLRQRESRQFLAFRQRRQIATLLLLRAVARQRLGSDRGVHVDDDRRAPAGMGDRFDQERKGEVVLPGSAVGLRDEDAQEAKLCRFAHQIGRKLLLLIDLSGAGRDVPGGKLLSQLLDLLVLRTELRLQLSTPGAGR
jgi:hypothetical protein